MWDYMLGNTELILLNIFIICVISIIIVKLYYRKHAEADVDIKIFNRGSDGGFFARKSHDETREIIHQNTFDNGYEPRPYYETPRPPIRQQNDTYQNNQFKPQNRPNTYAARPTYTNNPNINPVPQGERIMSNNKQNDEKENELKDLFTIDELIKESKRKSKVAANLKEETTEKEIPSFLTPEEKEEIKSQLEKETQELQEEEIEPVEETVEDTIASPTLKAPSKIEDVPAEEEIASADSDLLTETTMDDSELFEGEDEEYDELDYRKDLARITDKVKNSKIFNNVKSKLSVESEEAEDDPTMDEEFIRNVRSYDAPEEEEEYVAYEEPLFEEEKTPKVETAKDLHIKEVPKTDELQLKINNNPAILKKGDEIIYKYNGDTYSSKVFDIMGDDISVKFRGKHITVKPSDVKKIF